MANKLYNWLISRLRGIRYSLSTGFSQRLYTFGAIYHGKYDNYKHDPAPLIFCMWSDQKHTHGLNIHYMDQGDREWLIKTIYMVRKYSQNIDGRTLYNFIKMQRYNIVKKCYRMYFTSMCKYKMVSAGITSLDQLTYPSNEPFVRRLNEVINPRTLSMLPEQVAYSQEELQNRIIEGMNSIPIEQRTLRGNVPPGNPFIPKSSPFTRTFK
jgi:hypothetical protein